VGAPVGGLDGEPGDGPFQLQVDGQDGQHRGEQEPRPPQVLAGPGGEHRHGLQVKRALLSRQF
jgi:hypothetical protein